MPRFNEKNIDSEIKIRILNFLNEPKISNVNVGEQFPIPSKVARNKSKIKIPRQLVNQIIKKRNDSIDQRFFNVGMLGNIPRFTKNLFDVLVFLFGPAFYGKWQSLSNSPIAVIHAALLKTGKVLTFSGTAERNLPLVSKVWNPKSDTFTTQNYSDDLFCSHHSFLPNGKLLVNGGAHPGHAHGIKATYLFNPDTESWAKKSDMKYARWYPTTLTLPDGKVGTKVARYKWTSGWTAASFYRRGSNTYLFLLKAKGTGSDRRNVHIHRMNSNGTVGTKVARYKWTSGWTTVSIYNRSGNTYLFLLKKSGTGSDGRNVHIHRMISNGKVITFSGYSDTGSISEQPEIYYQDTNWQTLSNTARKSLQTYPGMHLIKNGRVFYTGTRWAARNFPWIFPPNTATFDPQTESWKDVDDHKYLDRTEGMSVILPPGNKVMVIGGKDTDTAEIIDLSKKKPRWKYVKKMNFKRRNVNAVLLPDQNVLVCSGIEGYKWDTDPKPVLTTELYVPKSNKWYKLADMKVPRYYHSVSILLPDARVVNMGSVKPLGNTDPTLGDINLKREIFSPPYLFRGKRPKIGKIPKTIHHYQQFVIPTKEASQINSVVLVKPQAVTHHTDSEQRVIPLKFKKAKNRLHVRAPSGSHPHAYDIQGYYMIFILNEKSVPSHAKFINLQ